MLKNLSKNDVSRVQKWVSNKQDELHSSTNKK